MNFAQREMCSHGLACRTPFGLFLKVKGRKNVSQESHFSRSVEITPHMDTADSVLQLLSFSKLIFYFFLFSVITPSFSSRCRLLICVGGFECWHVVFSKTSCFANKIRKGVECIGPLCLHIVLKGGSQGSV